MNDLPPQLESAEFGFAELDVIRPKPGYVWKNDHHITLKTEWEPGLLDPSRGVVSTSTEGEWRLLPGFVWNSSETSGFWSPGTPHPDHSGVIASTNVGKWSLAQGYAWQGESGLATVRIRQGNSPSNQSVVRKDEDYTEELIIGLGLIGLAYMADELLNGSEVTPEYIDDLVPCTYCDQTGGNPYYNDLVRHSAITNMDRTCPVCDGKGWVPASSSWW